MGIDPHNNPKGDSIYGDKVAGDKVLGNKIVAENVFIQPEERPPIWHGVPDMPTYFLGRDDLRQALATNLTSGNTLALSAEGLPGVGKTAVAVALAHDKHVLTHFSDGVLWAGLGKEPDVMGALNGWATALGSDVSQMVTPADRSQAVKNLIGQRRLLLVLDDAWQADAAQLLRCGGPHCTHLLTTRLKDVAHTFAGQTHATVVPELAPDPALALLQAHAPQACAADPDAAQKLVTAVGGLPLALELLGGYLGATRRSATPNLSQKALSDMADTKNRLALACQRLGDLSGSTVTLNETIALSLEGLDEEPGGADAVAAFYALGAFAPKPADFSWQAACAVADCDEATIAWLLERNLVQQVEAADNLLTLHQSLADVARQQLPPEATTRHRAYYLSIVNENREDWQYIAQIYEQIDWAWDALPENESVLDFIWALSIYHERQGLWQQDIVWAEQGLKISQSHELKEDQGILLNNIGLVYRRLGQLEEALRYYHEALPIMREVGDRAGEGATLNNLGLVYDGLGQPEESLRYYHEALPTHREVGNRAGEGTTLNNLGEVYRSLGHPEEALWYYHEALPIRREVSDRAGEGTTLNNLGLVYHSLGQPGEALRYHNEALPIRREVGDRWGEAQTRYNRLRIYWDQGDLDVAYTEMKIVVELTAAVQSPYLARFQEELAQLEAIMAQK